MPHSFQSAASDLISLQLPRCEDEQIRIPGSVQAHGFFLLLDHKGVRVVAASRNAEDFLGIPLKLLLGASLDTFLEREPLLAFRALMLTTTPAGFVHYLGAFRIKGELCSIVSHTIEGRRVLEFEQLDRLVSPELMNSVIANFVGKLGTLATERDLCQSIAEQVKELTLFNRVLLYSFDDAGNGTVLSEVTDGVLPSYLNLRFPASDIPQQARDLYVLNTVRCIPNVDYVPSPLLSLPDLGISAPLAFTSKRSSLQANTPQVHVSPSIATRLDLSHSVLRSVSPIHLEYMRNMETAASMSISIVCEGRLWGLISAHHATPMVVPFLIRSACDLLTKVVGTQLVAFRTAAQLQTKIHFHAVHRRILTQIAAENNYIAALESQVDDLMQVTHAAGAALLVDGRFTTAGGTPDEPSLFRITEWLDTMAPFEIFETNELGSHLEGASHYSGLASGLLAIRISDVKRSYLLWFRPEVVATLTWAGEPTKKRDAADRLSPRLSFASWQETVRGKSAPWTETEVQSGAEFRTDVLKVILKRAEEAEHLSEARFQQLTHAIPTLVWTSDDHGVLTYVNQRWREQGLEDHGRWFDTGKLVPEDAARCLQLWYHAVAEGISFEEEVRLRAGPLGEVRWHIVRAIPFDRADGTRAGWIGTFTDLTDRRERELALRMTEKLALTGRMTSVIAHEINNPLEAITNIIYILKAMTGQDPEAQEYLGMAESELGRISGITKQTLRWSRDNVLPSDWTTAGFLFEETLRLYSGKTRNRSVTVSSSVGSDTEVYGVVGQLQQVIANLFSNALDAAPVGGKISLEARESSSGGVELLVTDSGEGINPEVQKQLFQPFFSTKGDLGNGLGLYISQEIVERHQGTLVIESAPGHGTTVRVQLPNLPAIPAAGYATPPTNPQRSDVLRDGRPARAAVTS